MAQAFDANYAPFDRLSPDEIRAVSEALDIGYFRSPTSTLGELEADEKEDRAGRSAILGGDRRFGGVRQKI